MVHLDNSVALTNLVPRSCEVLPASDKFDAVTLLPLVHASHLFPGQVLTGNSWHVCHTFCR